MAKTPKWKVSMLIDEIVGKGNRFRDPIYGFVYLSDAEQRIVDTPIFQRLRRIHQLALEKYVYPGAEHSRFGHSLGVVHTATRLYESLFSKPDHLTPRQIDGKRQAIKTLRFAALLHDIGHLPFSHAVELELLPNGIGHEDVSAFSTSEPAGGLLGKMP